MPNSLHQQYVVDALGSCGYHSVWMRDKSLCIHGIDDAKYYLLADGSSGNYDCVLVDPRTGEDFSASSFCGVSSKFRLLKNIDKFIPELGIWDKCLGYVTTVVDRFSDYLSRTLLECGRHSVDLCELSLCAGTLEIDLRFEPTLDHSQITVEIRRAYLKTGRQVTMSIDADPEVIFKTICSDPLARSLWNAPNAGDYSAGSVFPYNKTAVGFGVNYVDTVGMVEVNGNIYKDLSEKPADKGYFKITTYEPSDTGTTQCDIITDGGDSWYQCMETTPGVIQETPTIRLGLAHKELIAESIRLFVEHWHSDNCS